MTTSNQLFSQVRNNPLGSSIELGRAALVKRRNLCDSQGVPSFVPARPSFVGRRPRAGIPRRQALPLSVRESRTGVIRLERNLAIAPLTALRSFDPNKVDEDEIDRLIKPVAPAADELSDDAERVSGRRRLCVSSRSPLRLSRRPRRRGGPGCQPRAAL